MPTRNRLDNVCTDHSEQTLAYAAVHSGEMLATVWLGRATLVLLALVELEDTGREELEDAGADEPAAPGRHWE